MKINATVIALAIVLTATPLSAIAAPLGSFKGAGATTTQADSNVVQTSIDAVASPSPLFVPATKLPDQTGNIKIAYSNGCGLALLGENSVTLEELQAALETSGKKGKFISKVKRSAGSFVLLVCGDGGAGYNVVATNRTGLTKLLAGKSKLSAGTTITANIKGANFMASATFANPTKTPGGTISSKDFEVSVGTDSSGAMWIVIVDVKSGKLAAFYPTSGLFYGNYNAEVSSIYNSTVGKLRSRPGSIDFILSN